MPRQRLRLFGRGRPVARGGAGVAIPPIQRGAVVAIVPVATRHGPVGSVAVGERVRVTVGVHVRVRMRVHVRVRVAVRVAVAVLKSRARHPRPAVVVREDVDHDARAADRRGGGGPR